MTSGRLQYIDALRGLAAIAVVFQHTAERIIIHNPDNSSVLQAFFVETINTGRFGIALFFLISGFVVPFSFKAPNPLARFIISRFFRLYPAYWLSIAAALAVLTLLTDAQYESRTILANITMLQTLVGEPGIIGPYWTLIIELAFYGTCALLFAAGRLSDWKALTAGFALLLGVSLGLSLYGALSDRYLSANLPLNLSFMFLGSLLRRSALEGDEKVRRLMPVILGGMIFSTGVILFLAADRHKVFYSATGFLSGYLLALAVFWLAMKASTPISQSLNRLGIVSYSLYLFHDICLTALEHAFALDNSSVFMHVSFAVVAVSSSVAVAIVVYYLVERPSITLGHIVARGLLPFGLPVLPTSGKKKEI